MVDFNRLSFGAPAAERDIRRGVDSYFIESTAYHNVNSEAKTILVANRGAGKSAILKTKDGAWAKLGSYATSWKYLLLVLIMKELTKRHGRIRRGAESQIYAYLRDHYEGAAATPFDSFVSYLRRIESIKIGNYEASVRDRPSTAR